MVHNLRCWGAAWALAGLLLVPLPLHAQQGAASAPPGRELPARAALVQLLTGTAGNTPSTAAFKPPGCLGREIAALGLPVLPALYELLQTRGFELPDTENGWYALDSAGEAEVAQALARLPRLEVATLLSSAVRPAADAAERRAALVGMSAFATQQEFELCLVIAAPQARADLDLPPELSSAQFEQQAALLTSFEDLLVEMLQRDSRVASSLRAAWPSSDGLQREAFARAAQRFGGDAGMELLLHWLAGASAERGLVADLLAQLGPSLEHEQRLRVAGALRPLVDAADQHLRCAGLLAAGRLDDWEQAPLLVERLADAPAAERSAAAWSLQRLSGLGLGDDVRAWRDWWSREERFWDTAAPTLFEELRTAEPGRAFAALNQLAQHRFRRDQSALAIAELLWSEEPALAVLAADALGQLGSRRVLPDLVECARAGYPELSSAARGALERLGHPLPSE